MGFAEIARGLGRPTSTVSREVARNGGLDGYRPDQAQQSTARRAGRRRPAPGPSRPAAGGAYGRDPEAVRGFVERFAAVVAQTGLSRMASRVFVSLFTSDADSLTAAELVQHLRVSPASISKAVGYLEELELVERERDARSRRQRYVAGRGDVWLRAWQASARKNASWADIARQGVEILGAATPAGARLDDMGRFFAQVAGEMAGGPAAAAVDDALTVLAALVHAGVPPAPDDLAAALDWPPERVAAALRCAGPERITAARRQPVAGGQMLGRPGPRTR
jgi:hypothetical protein